LNSLYGIFFLLPLLFFPFFPMYILAANKCCSMLQVFCLARIYWSVQQYYWWFHFFQLSVLWCVYYIFLLYTWLFDFLFGYFQLTKWRNDCLICSCCLVIHYIFTNKCFITVEFQVSGSAPFSPNASILLWFHYFPATKLHKSSCLWVRVNTQCKGLKKVQAPARPGKNNPTNRNRTK